jgi:uncharacterized paraquat-inducible protein A
MSEIEIHCPHCELLFDVPRSMVGGIASCPDCERTVPIKSGPEPLYWILVGFAVLTVLVVSGGVAFISPIAGAIVAVVGLAAVVLVAACM